MFQEKVEYGNVQKRMESTEEVKASREWRILQSDEKVEVR